jgi:hypothetical protein
VVSAEEPNGKYLEVLNIRNGKMIGRIKEKTGK